MKSKKKLLVAVTLLLVAVFMTTGLVSTKLKTLQGEDVDSQELRSLIVEGWEKEPWDIEAVPKKPQSAAKVKLVNGFPKNQSSATNKKSLAVKFQFIFPGDNVVHLVPPKSRTVTRSFGPIDQDFNRKSRQVPGIELPGKVKKVSVWVLGRGNEYRLEGWIQDWKGDVRIYNFGSLDFIGWRPLTVEIPISVPQDIGSYPQTKTLVFKRFVIRQEKNASKESVVLFFDSLKVLTDVFDLFFDGADMNFDKSDEKAKARMKKYIEQLRAQNRAK